MALSKTLWYVPWSTDLLPEDSIGLSYYKVNYELPIYKDGTTDLWKQSPVWQTKLSTYNIFRSRYSMVPNSLVVYINDNPVSFTTSSGSIFTIDSSVTDGYMWISYTLLTTSDKLQPIPKGGSRLSLTTAKINTEVVKQIRYAINRLEKYLSIPLTLWRGGVDNTEYGGDDNIIPLYTAVIADHIVEMYTAVINIGNRIRILTSNEVIYFPDDPQINNEKEKYSISMLENIRLAINYYEKVTQDFDL